MLLRDLLNLQRDESSIILAKKLKMPMPDEILGQLVNPEASRRLQKQYGHLDLHAMRWELRSLPIMEILSCQMDYSIHEEIEAIGRRTLFVFRDGWSELNLPPEVVNHWLEHGTWKNAPVMLHGDDGQLHLIEGRHRLGTLTGLYRTAFLLSYSTHSVWVGLLNKGINARVSG